METSTIILIVSAAVFIAFAVLIGLKFRSETKKVWNKHRRNMQILNYRDELLNKMQLSGSHNHQFLLDRIKQPNIGKLIQERVDRDALMWETWHKFPYETLRDGTQTLEEVYTDDVLAALLWRFEPETILKSNSTLVH